MIRVLPEPDESAQKYEELYQALNRFKGCSGVNYLELSKTDSYARLQQLMGKQPGEAWSDEDRRETVFSSTLKHRRMGDIG